MKRRQFTMLILLLAGIVLWLTRGWWLPAILAYLPLVEKRSDLLQALDALVSMAMLLFNAVLAYILWLSRSGKRDERAWEMEPLRPTTPQDIHERLGRGGRVHWIDREATRLGDLRAHGRLIITGRMKLGKTREAAELISCAVAEDLVPPDRVYEPGPALRFLSQESLRTVLQRSLDPQMPVLIFVDDLPYHFHSTGLNRLAEALAAIRACKIAYVVATARTDQLTEAHRAWLEQYGFHTIELRDLSAEQIGRLVDAAASTFKLQVDNAARVKFVAGRDGTPELTIMGLRRLSAEGVIRVDQATARRVMRESLAEAWEETRRYIQDRVPAAGIILDALGTFHAAGVDAYTPLVLHYAAYLWQQRGRWHRPLLSM